MVYNPTNPAQNVIQFSDYYPIKNGQAYIIDIKKIKRAKKNKSEDNLEAEVAVWMNCNGNTYYDEILIKNMGSLLFF